MLYDMVKGREVWHKMKNTSFLELFPEVYDTIFLT